MHRQSLMIKAPNSFVEQVLWPEFQELNGALVAYLSEITEKVIRERMAIYRKETAPIIALYDQQGVLVKIDGMGTVDEVTERVSKAIESMTG